MAAVLLIGAAADSAKTHAIATYLEQAGLEVLKADAQPPTDVRPSCLIVCHSARSLALAASIERYLNRRKSRRKLVHVRLDRQAPVFRDQVDLSAWKGGPGYPGLAVLLDRVQSIQRSKTRRRLALAAPTVLAAIAYVSLVNDGWQMGETLWRTVAKDEWRAAERRLPLFENGPARASRREAELAVLGLARAQADRLCSALEVGGEIRVVSAAGTGEVLDCDSFEGEWRCRWRGTALCRVEERQVD